MKAFALLPERFLAIRPTHRFYPVGHLRQASSDSLDDLMENVDRLLDDLSSKETEAAAKTTDWGTIDWNRWGRLALANSRTVAQDPANLKIATAQDLRPTQQSSPVEILWIRGRLVYIKRDDLLRLPGSHVSGNKARKMLSLNQIDAEEFPECLVSYGGPQSNAMLALAAIVNAKNVELGLCGTDVDGDGTGGLPRLGSDMKPKRFVYYTKTLPRFLRKQPSGNYFRAISLGMEIRQVNHKQYHDLFGSEWGGKPEAPVGLEPPVPNGRSVWVPQGGACAMAVSGAKLQANEIITFWKAHGNGRPLSVCLPGGTCGTAALLHQEIQNQNKEEHLDIQVVVIPCVGDGAYARRQILALNRQTLGDSEHSRLHDVPTILPPIPDTFYFGQSMNREPGDYFSFGTPDAKIIDTFREMKDNGLVLDLLYGAPSWAIMLRHWRTNPKMEVGFDVNNPLAGREIMYVHSGGLEGINSQLLRYKHKGLVELNEIQPPGKSQNTPTSRRT